MTYKALKARRAAGYRYIIYSALYIREWRIWGKYIKYGI